MDISILRKAPQDRIRTVPAFGGDVTVDVLFCGHEEVTKVREQAAELVKGGYESEAAYNVAWGRVALRGWSGLTDNGEPLPFDTDNSDLLMLQCAEIRAAVIAAASSLAGGVEKN